MNRTFDMTYDKTISVLAVLSLLARNAPPKQPPQTVEKPHGPLLVRSYLPTSFHP